MLEERKRGNDWQDAAQSKCGKSGECGVCLDARINVALDPCGHTLCAACSTRVRQCPFCKEEIRNRKRIYLS